MILLVVQTGTRRRSLYLRWHGRYSHAKIQGVGRSLVIPFGDYHFSRTQYSHRKVYVRRMKRPKEA